MLVQFYIRFFGALACVSTSALAIPTNDHFAARSSLGSLARVTVHGDNTGATLEPDENDLDFLGGASVWWSWTAPDTGPVTIDTEGSVIDTVLGVFSGGPTLEEVDAIGFNDESFGGGAPGSSRLKFVAAAGETYAIAVHGFLGEQGPFALTVSQGELRPFTLGAFVLSASSFENSAAGQTLTIDINVLSQSPLVGGELLAHRPGFIATDSLAFTVSQRVSGSVTNGQYRLSFSIPRYAPGGAWILELALEDAAGRETVFGKGISAVFDYEELFGEGQPNLFFVNNGGETDVTPPSLTALSLGAATLDLTVNAAPQNITFQATDDLAGVEFATLTLLQPLGEAMTSFPIASAQRTSGTALSGAYAFSWVMPPRLPEGTWRAILHLRDATGNAASFDAGEFFVAGSSHGYWAWLYPLRPGDPGTAPDEDLDGDGMTNLLEYAFGLQEDVNSSLTAELLNAVDLAGLPVVSLTRNGQLEIDFVRRRDAAGLVYRAEFSGNLSGPWIPAVSLELGHGNDVFDRLIARDPESSGPRRFARVRVLVPNF